MNSLKAAFAAGQQKFITIWVTIKNKLVKILFKVPNDDSIN